MHELQLGGEHARQAQLIECSAKSVDAEGGNKNQRCGDGQDGPDQYRGQRKPTPRHGVPHQFHAGNRIEYRIEDSDHQCEWHGQKHFPPDSYKLYVPQSRDGNRKDDHWQHRGDCVTIKGYDDEDVGKRGQYRGPRSDPR